VGLRSLFYGELYQLDGISSDLHWLVLTDHDFLSIKLHNTMIRYVTFCLYVNPILCDKYRLALPLGWLIVITSPTEW